MQGAHAGTGEARRVRTFAGAECGFGYRNSRFKGGRAATSCSRWRFRSSTATSSAPIGYAELARRLGVRDRRPGAGAEVRAAVLGLRRGKGMVLDADDHDTWSAGSFFTNPILPAETAAAAARRRARAGRCPTAGSRSAPPG